MYDGSLLMETAEKLLVEIEKGKKEDIKMQRIISDSVLKEQDQFVRIFTKPLIHYSNKEI